MISRRRSDFRPLVLQFFPFSLNSWLVTGRVEYLQLEEFHRIILELLPLPFSRTRRSNIAYTKFHHSTHSTFRNTFVAINPLNPELNPICYLLALLAHHFLHVSRIRVKSLTIRLLMSYICGAPILDVSRSHTTTHHSR